jgi:hypothetical protein
MTAHDEEDNSGGGARRIRGKIYKPRVTVTLRLDPDLHIRLMELCDEQSISANGYMTSLIETDLKKRKK